MKIKAGIKDKLVKTMGDSRNDNQSFEQDSGLKKVQNKIFYQNVDAEEEIEVKDEPLNFKEYAENGKCVLQISVLDENKIDEFALPTKNSTNGNTSTKESELVKTLKRSLASSETSSESDSSDEEISIPKKELNKLRNKIFHLKKKVRTLESEKVSLLKQLEDVISTSQRSEEVSPTSTTENREDLSTADTRSSKIVEMIEMIWQNTQEIKTLIEGQNMHMTTQGESTTKQKSSHDEVKKITFGTVQFPEHIFKIISQRKKHSLFVKDLVSLLWEDEELINKSVTGKKSINSLESKDPLTPEKLCGIREAFKDRLKKLEFTEYTAEGELKLMNRYISEKISDARKKKTKRVLN